MRQLCPHCAHAVEVPDSAAGTDFPCPMCLERIKVPAAYSPEVVPDAPPPGLVPPSPPTAAPSADRPAPPPGLVLLGPAPGAERRRASARPGEVGPRGEWAVSLAPSWVPWVPLGALAVAVVLTFFSWAGAFPGGFRVYTQTPWQAVTGAITNQTLLEESISEARELRAAAPSNWPLMLPYFLALFGALGLTILERFVEPIQPGRVPPVLGWAVPASRAPLLPATLLAAVAFVLLVSQRSVGFGLETAVRERVAAEVAKLVKGQNDKDATPFQIGSIEGRYSLSPTTALDMALMAHGLAAAALALRWSEERRGTSARPKVLLQW